MKYRVVIFVILFACCLSLTGHAQEQDDPITVNTVRLGDYFADTPDKAETERLATVLGEFDALRDKGSTLRFSNRKTRYIAPRMVYLEALKKNLALQVDEQDAEVAKAAIMEAEAVFDPVLTLSFAYSESDTNTRSKEIVLQTKKFQPPPETAIPIDPGNPEAQIVAIGWQNQVAGIKSVRTVYASEPAEHGPTKVFNYSLDISQQLPWGSELGLGLSLQDKDVYYDSSNHSYDRPWSASFMANLVAPLPMAKNFGPDSSNESAIRMREKSSEISGLNVKAAINQILYEAEMAYWNVVRRFENLNVLIKRRQLLERQVASVNKRFENREATNYDRLQVEASLARTKVLEVDAANALLDASNVLAALIESEDGALEGNIYLPYAYLGLLSETETPDTATALARAVEQRPELKMRQAGIEYSEINRAFAKNQALADLKVSARYSSSQDASVYGYSSPWSSMGFMANPDKEDYSFSLDYEYPILNRALDARFEQAKIGVRQAGLSQRITKNSVIREVEDATALVRTSRSRVEAAMESEKFATLAYDKLLARQEYGDVSEFELLLALQRLSEAQISTILAHIDHRTALTGLLAATGEIAVASADKTSTPLDNHRLAVMRHNSLLTNFTRKTHGQER